MSSDRPSAPGDPPKPSRPNPSIPEKRLTSRKDRGSASAEKKRSSGGWTTRKSPTTGRFVVRKGSTGKFRFSLVSTNGQVVATSEAYNTKASAINGIRSVKSLAADATIEDQTTKEWAAGESERKAAASAKKAKRAKPGSRQGTHAV